MVALEQCIKDKTIAIMFKAGNKMSHCRDLNWLRVLFNKVNRTTEAQFSHSSNPHKWLPFQILGGKTVNHPNKSTKDLTDRAMR